MNTEPEAATPAPNPSDAQFEHLAPRALWGMRAAALFGFALPYILPAMILLAAWDSAGLSAAAKTTLFFVGLALATVLAWRYGRARYERTTFTLDAAGLRIRRGVFWRSETLVPRSRVQHTDINRGPLDRRFGLATLKVYTAGTKLASLSLDGLPQARAVELRDALVEAVDDAL